jgi:hypothetical protein
LAASAGGYRYYSEIQFFQAVKEMETKSQAYQDSVIKEAQLQNEFGKGFNQVTA